MMMRGPPPHVRAGDWLCPTDGCPNNKAYVFAKNASCPACGIPKPEVTSAPAWPESTPPWVSPGDWSCPTAGCKNSTAFVFSSKVSCPECGAAKPDQAAVAPPRATWGNLGGMAAAAPMMMQMMMGKGGGSGGKGSWGPPPWTNPGDWQCPNASCKNHTAYCFASKLQCPACGTGKPMAQNYVQAPGMYGCGGGYGVGGGGGGRPSYAAPGDWYCPNVQCKNNTAMVFASKSACPACGQPKPGGQGKGMGGYGACCGGGKGDWGGGGGKGGGDWQCPNTACKNNQAMVFGSKSACPSCGSPKPGGVRIAPY